jgi:hypothetical protein
MENTCRFPILLISPLGLWFTPAFRTPHTKPVLVDLVYEVELWRAAKRMRPGCAKERKIAERVWSQLPTS